VGNVFGAGEKAEEGSALLRSVVANGAAEHGVGGFDGVEDRAQRDRALHVNLNFAADVGEIAEMRGKLDTNHDGHLLYVFD
jgi:hypothetical protein